MPEQSMHPAVVRRRERRYVRRVAAASMAGMGFFGILARIFKPSAGDQVAVQQQLRSGDPAELISRDDTEAPRFTGKVRLPRSQSSD